MQVKKVQAILDAELEELKKALELDADSTLMKSTSEADNEDDEDEDDEDEEDDEEDDEEGDEEDEDNEDEDEEDEEDEDDEDEDNEDEDGSKLTKGLAGKGHRAAFEVSDFLRDITDSIGYSIEGLEKSLVHMNKQNTSTATALIAVGDLVKSLSEAVDGLAKDNAELKASLESVLSTPVGRKGVVNSREVQTLSKSVGSKQPTKKSRNEIGEILFKSFEAGLIKGSEVARYEAGVSLDKLALPQSVIEEINN